MDYLNVSTYAVVNINPIKTSIYKYNPRSVYVNKSIGYKIGKLAQ